MNPSPQKSMDGFVSSPYPELKEYIPRPVTPSSEHLYDLPLVKAMPNRQSNTTVRKTNDWNRHYTDTYSTKGSLPSDVQRVQSLPGSKSKLIPVNSESGEFLECIPILTVQLSLFSIS